MTTDRDTTRIVRSWLSSDEHESADRVLDTVLDLLDATPQRRAWWPAWRIAQVNTYAKLATAVAAIAAVAVVAVMFFPRSSGVTSPGPSPSPIPSLTPTASAAASPSAEPSPEIAFPPAGSLSPGRQTFTEDGIVFTMDVPAGWSSSGLNCTNACATDAGWLQKGSPDSSPTSVWMPIWRVVGVAADPCGHTAAPEATSATALADAVAGIKGVQVVTPPEAATVGGKPARHVTIRLPDNIACKPNDFYLWYGKNGTGEFRWGSFVGETNDVWTVDIGGKTFWLEAETYKGSSKALTTEIQAMIDSIRFQ